jgi:hypothetical protein
VSRRRDAVSALILVRIYVALAHRGYFTPARYSKKIARAVSFFRPIFGAPSRAIEVQKTSRDAKRLRSLPIVLR